MKIYYLRRKQQLPIALEIAWGFFSSPYNLIKITPPELSFHVVSVTGSTEVYAGQIMEYHLGIFPFMKSTWVSEITYVKKPTYFVDEQRLGPYALWHHEHFLEETPGGVLMRDEVSYAIGYGLLGRFIHFFLVRPKLEKIFDYRERSLQALFPKP